jgi:hypothetical protein
MRVAFLLWERHLAAMIVAGAYSADVAADSAIAAPVATVAPAESAGLATKAGSHSHKGDTSLPIGLRQRAQHQQENRQTKPQHFIPPNPDNPEHHFDFWDTYIPTSQETRITR